MPVPRITKEELKQRLETSDAALQPYVIDVRLKYPYEHSSVRLPGAHRMAWDAIDSSAIPRNRDVVTYDSDPDEITSSSVAAGLIRQGFRACALKGGVAEWVGANFPVETKAAVHAAAPQPGAVKGQN
jgi:rhodanese-related sulfurtransferase